MLDLPKLKQTRGTIKATLTNIKKFADERSTEPPENQVVNKEQIETRLEKLEKAWTEFHEISDSIAMLSNSSQQSEVDNFEEAFFETEAILKRLLRARMPSLVPKADHDTTYHKSILDHERPGLVGDVRLPRIQIETFAGDYSKWPSFYDQYVKAVHSNESITNANKFQYLKTLLKGDAAELLRHLPITEESYTEAWDKLLKRFDRKKNIVKDYVELFMNQSPVNPSSTKSLRSLCDLSDQVLRGIKSLGGDWQGRDPWLLNIILKKLDPETHQLWAIHSNNNTKPTIDDLITFLSGRCDALECTTTKRQPISNCKQTSVKIHAATNDVPKFNQCPMCKNNHPLFRCYRFKGLKPPARNKYVLNNKLCCNCLRPEHMLDDCESERTCYICGEKHNTLLHLSDRATTNHTFIAAQPTNSSINNGTSKINNSQLLVETSCNLATPQKIKETKVEPELSISNHEKSSDVMKSLASCSITSYISEDWASQALLSTVQLNISDGCNLIQKARALLDSGSQSTLITESLAHRLKLQRSPVSCIISGLAAKPAASARGCMKLQLSSIHSNKRIIHVDALILPKLTSHIPARQINKARWEVINDLKLADPNFEIPGQIDMILGNDIFLEVLLPEKIIIQPNVIAQHTIFGWVIGGKLVTSETSENVQAYHITTTTNHEELKVVEKFWQVEEICMEKKMKLEDSKCEQYYTSTTYREANGRFSVRLPFKESNQVLGVSYINAERRLLSMERKFVRQPEVATKYSEFMQEYLDLGHMERISQEDDVHFDQPHFYLPHHAVFKESSTTTKLRVVFDGSCKSTSSASINEILWPGPVLQDDLTSILLRFHNHSIAISADIEKMYRQVNVQPSDCEFQRILWRSDPSTPVQHYRLKTVTYGITSAPFLAIRSMIELANIYESTFPKGSSILKKDFYVDDMLTGCEDYETALEIYHQMSKILAEGGFKIRKWISNCKSLLDIIPAIDRGTDDSISLDDDTTYYKTLGLHWNPLRDCFNYKVKLQDQMKLSKRNLLSEASKVFDPLGLLTPITITFKMLFQEVWRRKIDWDEELPQDIAERWNAIKSTLHQLETIEVSRCLKISKPVSMELHIFCDASQHAYGAAAYLRSEDSAGNVLIRLISAKSRVAPMETVTIPRLELCAAVLGTKLYKYLQQALGLSIDNVYAWTDSQVVLAWLSDHPCRWKNFVANRTAFIRQLLPEHHWHHVDTKLNPADHTSRGLTPRQLTTNDLWWSGPGYLKHAKFLWPTSNNGPHSDIPEQRKVKVLSSMVRCEFKVKLLINTCKHLFNYYSSLQKIYRIVSYICRYHINKRIFYFKNKITLVSTSEFSNVTLPPTVMELELAENICVRWAQYDAFKKEVVALQQRMNIDKDSKLLSLTPFLDENQIIRVGGRLSMSDCDFNTKYPVILPKDHVLTRYIISYLHEHHLHVGATTLITIIRQRYWVIGCRNMVRHHILKCIPCFKRRRHQNEQIMGQLPQYRVTTGRPFLHTGVDYAGPIFIRDRSGRGSFKPIKSYVALFICTRIKAIQIEIVSNLTSEAFIMALQRFIAKRGKPLEILSDNGSNFVGARRELDGLFELFKSEEHFNIVSKCLTPQKINFRFIPARSPHFGGLWEANIKSYKQLLLRSIGNTPLTFEQLYTVSSQIEGILNSRPLCSLSESPDNFDILTPGHFLIGGPITALPEPHLKEVPISRLSRYQHLQLRVEMFWKRWSKDYLTTLQQRAKWRLAYPNLCEGQLVLVNEENLPKATWIIGRIVKIFPGRDGKVRVAAVKTSNGEFQRSIVKLVPVPIDQVEMQSSS